MTDFFEKLIHETENERKSFLSIPTLVHGVQGQISKASYVAFLTQAYHHVKHTVPLLMACGSKVTPEYEWLREVVGEYIEEEMGHQEWILNDIKACGEDAEQVRNSDPAPETELMIAYAYYLIDWVNPLAFFGMVLVLEGTSIRLALDAADAIKVNLGLPDEAFSYLSSHGALDVKHMEFFRNTVNKFEKKSDQDAVIKSARMFYRLYGDIFRNLPVDVLDENPTETIA